MAHLHCVESCSTRLPVGTGLKLACLPSLPKLPACYNLLRSWTAAMAKTAWLPRPGRRGAKPFRRACPGQHAGVHSHHCSLRCVKVSASALRGHLL